MSEVQTKIKYEKKVYCSIEMDMDALEVRASPYKRIDYDDEVGETVWYGLEINERSYKLLLSCLKEREE